MGHRFATGLGAARFEALPQQVLWQITPDENKACLTPFLLLPGALTSAFNEHVDALNDKLPILILDRCDALHAHNVRPVALGDVLNPGHEPVGLHRPVGDQGQAVDRVVVFVPIFVEESRLDFEDALEIEGVLSQHLGKIDAATLRSVNPCIGVDASDAALDCREAVRIDKIDLVDENDVGEGELLLRFRRTVDLFEEMFGIRDRDDGVELRPAANLLIDKECLRYRRGIWGRPLPRTSGQRLPMWLRVTPHSASSGSAGVRSLSFLESRIFPRFQRFSSSGFPHNSISPFALPDAS